MASIDPNYRPWHSRAARKIVEQLNDGTLERCAEVGSRIADLTTEEAMARQIVGILLSHSTGEN